MSIRIYAKDKSVSYRISRYWWQNKAYLTLTGQLLVDMRTGQSLPDRVLWEHTAKELRKIQPGTNFDQGKAKVNAEFFVGGYAFAYDEHTTISSVQVTIGHIKKTAAIYGDRFWLKSGPLSSISAPLPFKHIPLSWHNAFGGPTCAINPQGKGQAANEQGLWPLANIENPSCIIDHPHQRVAPMGFLPTHLTPKQRHRLGTFDDQWLKEAWPYLPHDHDMHYWNTAPEDQQQPKFWVGNERITCIHMHPHKPIVDFELQGQKIRAFYQKKQQTPQEMQLNFDTIWLFPHLEQVLMIWHGTIPVVDETAFDIEAMLLAEENAQTGTLSFEHYVALLQNKIDRPPPPLIAKEPKPLKKRELHPTIAKKADEHAAKSTARLQRTQQRKAQLKQMEDALAAQLKANPLPFDLQAKQAAESPLSYDQSLSLDDNIKGIMAAAQQYLTPEAKKIWQEAEHTPITPPDFTAIKAQLTQTFAHVPNEHQATFAAILAEVDGIEAHYQNKQQSLLKSSKATLSVTEQITKALQEKCFKNMLICQQHFNEVVFEDISFTKVHFRNCYFKNCSFKKNTGNAVTFENCTIEHTHVLNSAWVNFTLCKTSFSHSTFDHCSFEQWRFTQSTFQHIIFEQCILKNGRDRSSQWSLCLFKLCQDSNSHYKHTQFHEVLWQNHHFMRTYIDHCSVKTSELNQSRLHSVSFDESVLQKIHFYACQAKVLSFDHCQLTGISFKQVNMPSVNVRHCQWSGWQVIDSDFSKLLCVTSTLINLEFSHSNFFNSRYKALTQCHNITFEHIDLQKSFFENFPLSYGQFQHCDLTQSIWHRCQIDSGKFNANVAVLSRFEDCVFTKTRLNNNNYFQGSFKRSLFKQTDISDCNLIRVNFYHASSDQLTMQHCLLPDPLPIGFWERWQGVEHE